MSDAPPMVSLVATSAELRKLQKLIQTTQGLNAKLQNVKQQIREKGKGDKVEMNERLHELLTKVYSDSLLLADQTDKQMGTVSASLSVLYPAVQPKKRSADEWDAGSSSPIKNKKKKNPSASSAGSMAGVAALYAKGDPPPGDEVAARVNTKNREWILSRWITQKPNGKVEVEDADPGDDDEPNPVRKRYNLSREQVLPLPHTYHQLPKGSAVVAMFPDTSTFYEATVIAGPNSKKAPPEYTLRFVDDEDNERKVAAHYVLPSPFA